MRMLLLSSLALMLAGCATAPPSAGAPAAQTEPLIEHADPCPIDVPEDERSEFEWFTRVDCLVKADQNNKAVSVAAQALERFPESMSLYALMAFSYVELRQWRDAIRALRIALALSAANNDVIASTPRNNLLWASVWVDGEVTQGEQLAHLHVLERAEVDCMVRHTAIFVLHPIALSSRSNVHVGTLNEYAAAFLSDCVGGASAKHPADTEDVEYVVAPEDVYAALVVLDHATRVLDGHELFVPWELPLALAARAVVRAMPEGREDAAVCAETLPDPALHPECTRGLTQARAELTPEGPPSR